MAAKLDSHEYFYYLFSISLSASSFSCILSYFTYLNMVMEMMYLLFSNKKKLKSNIYIGDITVIPRSGLKKTITNMHPSLAGQSDGAVIDALCKLMDLPHKSSRELKIASDLALDVIVPEYNFGEFMIFYFGAYWVPFLWKPKIVITGRLYEIDSDKTIYAATVKQTLGWTAWAKKVFSLSRLLRINAFMSKTDAEHMTIEAATKLLSKISKNT